MATCVASVRRACANSSRRATSYSARSAETSSRFAATQVSRPKLLRHSLGPPAIRVRRPAGSPPAANSSRPALPLGAFAMTRRPGAEGAIARDRAMAIVDGARPLRNDEFDSQPAARVAQAAAGEVRILAIAVMGSTRREPVHTTVITVRNTGLAVRVCLVSWVVSSPLRWGCKPVPSFRRLVANRCRAALPPERPVRAC